LLCEAGSPFPSFLLLFIFLPVCEFEASSAAVVQPALFSGGHEKAEWIAFG
jgi:hypothetical protein